MYNYYLVNWKLVSIFLTVSFTQSKFINGVIKYLYGGVL